MTGPRKGARAKSELAIPRSAPDQMSAMFLQSTSQKNRSDASRKREEKEGRTYPPAVTTDQNVQLSAPDLKPNSQSNDRQLDSQFVKGAAPKKPAKNRVIKTVWMFCAQAPPMWKRVKQA